VTRELFSISICKKKTIDMEETMWKKLMRLNSPDVMNKLCLYYGNFLPMEVRYHLCEWLESTIT
jgi:hypothetical protein